MQNDASDTNLKDTPHASHNPLLGPPLLLLTISVTQTSPPLLLGDINPRNPPLALAHTRINIDILEGDEEGAVRGPLEPRIHFPDEVEADEEGACEVQLEEGFGVEVRPADGVEGHVELRD